VLNQAEIDSLLGFGSGPARDQAQSGIERIISSGLVAYERLPMLEIVFDRLVRLMTTTLRNFTSDNVEISIDAMASQRFGDHLNSIPLPAMLAVFKAEQWDNYGLIVIDSALIYSVVDVLLGGRRGTAAMLDAPAATSSPSRRPRDTAASRSMLSIAKSQCVRPGCCAPKTDTTGRSAANTHPRLRDAHHPPRCQPRRGVEQALISKVAQVLRREAGRVEVTPRPIADLDNRSAIFRARKLRVRNVAADHVNAGVAPRPQYLFWQ
jgi:hypothetical protein